MTTTSGSAKWQGGIKDGKGAISTKSGALNDYPYGFASRFEGKPGSNPEELIGAAHAACFTMALSLILGEAKLTAEHMETKADVTLEKQGDGFAITSVHLTLNAKIPGADKATFEDPTPSVLDGQWHDAATKLDLAKAYQEMGDVEGAREILQEVLHEGDDQQKTEAKALLAKLA